MENENFIQAPYLAKKQLVMANDISLIGQAELRKMIETSYTLIVQKLSKKAQKEILE